MNDLDSRITSQVIALFNESETLRTIANRLDTGSEKDVNGPGINWLRDAADEKQDRLLKLANAMGQQ